MKRLLFAIFLFPFLTQAQPFLDIASVFYQYGPPDKAADKNPVYTDLAYAQVTLPLRIDSDYFVINPVYEGLRMVFPKNFVNRDFQIAYMPLSWVHSWNQKWKTIFVFIPRMSSALAKKFGDKDMQYGGVILNAYEKKATLKFKFGVYYNREFFGPFVMPLLGIDWNINSKWNLFGVLPGSMTLEYKFMKNIHGGILLRSLTNSYRTIEKSFIRVNDNHLRLFFDFYVSKGHVLSVEAGHSILRKYKSGTRDSGNTDYYSMNVTDGSLLRVMYAFRIRTDAQKNNH